MSATTGTDATTFAYTASGALASVATPTASVAYTSDGRGLRQSRTVDGTTKQFTWSSVGGLPLLLDDSDHAYLYGPSSTPLAQVDDTTGDTQYLHADLLGTPRLITDESGAAVGTGSYDAFGNLAAHTGIRSVFGFTGNLIDDVTGLLYLRARDYDATTGQFLTVDPAVDRTRQPYAYTGNNPVTRTDPTGLDFGENLAAFGAGFLDGLTGGVSSMVLELTVPGYDAFIKSHNTAFQIGSVSAQVIVAVVQIVGTAGVGAIAVAGRYLVAAGAKAVVREGERLALAEGKHLLEQGAERAVVQGAERVAERGLRPGVRRTLDNALDRDTLISDTVSHYGINLRGSGQSIKVLFNPGLPNPGVVRAAAPNIIEVGPSAFASSEELARTIAHELNHVRSFLKGGDAPESAAYAAEGFLSEWMAGFR